MPQGNLETVTVTAPQGNLPEVTVTGTHATATAPPLLAQEFFFGTNDMDLDPILGLLEQDARSLPNR